MWAFFRACFLVFIACLTDSLAFSCNKKREIFPPFGSKPDICSVCTLSRLTSCSASIRHSSLQPVFSAVIKVPHPTPPTHTPHPRSLCMHSLGTEMRRGGKRGEEERWRDGEVALSGGCEVGPQRQLSDDLNPLSLSLFLFLQPPPRSPAPPCRVSQPLLDRCVPDYTTFTTVGDWLDAIKMSRYRDNFVNAGFASFDLVAQMTAE